MRWLVTLLLLATLPAVAQEDGAPFVEVKVTPESVIVGEEIRLEVLVLVPTWMPSAPVFPSFELANTITRLPPNASRSTSRRIGRDNWSGVQRNYTITPLLGANFRLEGLSVRVTYADPDDYQPVTVEVPIPEFTFSAAVPEGAEGLDPYVAGTRFTLRREIEGDTENLQAGDALVVRYIAELDGLPSVFIPSLVDRIDVPGVSVYPETPRVEDDGVASRTEKLTYVFENGGEFTAPPLSIDWWNTDTGTVETSTVEAFSVFVAGAPMERQTTETAEQPVRWRRVILALLLVVAGFIAWRRYGPAVGQWLEARQEAKLASESFAWHQLSRSLQLQTGEISDVPAALAAWLSRIAPELNARSFAVEYGSEGLILELNRLSASLFAGGTEAPDLNALTRELEQARKRRLVESERGPEAALPPLNP